MRTTQNFQLYQNFLLISSRLSRLTQNARNKYYYIEMQHQRKGDKVGIQKTLILKNLTRILQNSCILCYCQFNDQERTPYVLYPCQHLYCQSCVKQLLQEKNQSFCKSCQHKISKQNLKPNKIALTILKIIQSFNSTEETSDTVSVENQVAMKLLYQGGGYFYECPKCKRQYNRQGRLPNIICQNQHILCSECLAKAFNSQEPPKCQRCSKKYLSEFFTNKIVINVSQLIHKILFCQTVAFVINQTELKVITHSQTTIKDIFHLLQQFDHLSTKLQIKLCRFYKEVVKQNSVEKEEVKYDERIGSGKIKKIFLEFGEQALKMGSRVTMPSKIIQQLPIKINNFQQRRRPQLQQLNQANIFGQMVKPQTSQLYNMAVKSNRQRQPTNIYPSLKVSQSKLKLLEHSKKVEEYRQKDFESSQIKAIKQSRVKRKGKELIAGTQINPLFIQNINTKLPQSKRPDVLKNFLDNHKVTPTDQKYLCHDVFKVMNKPFSMNQIQISLKMQKEIQQKALKGDQLSLIMHLLKKELQDGQIKISYTPKSTQRSKLTLKVITSHLLTDRFIIQEKMSEEQEFAFQNMNTQQPLFKKFIQKQISKYVNLFDLSEKNIVIHNLVKGSNILVFSTNQGHLLANHIKNNLDKDITIHPYFTQLQLSPQDFDSKGNIKFNDEKKNIEFRGSWPYYQPIKCVRHGINVSKKFDNGNDDWLQMKNGPGEWAVGFHGIRHPNQAYKHYKNVILSILSGLHNLNKQMLIVVQNANQAYASSRCVNQRGQAVGRGVYLSPMFCETLPYTSPQRVGDIEYHIVFQCRLKPQEIRIPSNKQNYWVVRNSSAIRPYGIVLIENKDRIAYPKPLVQFGEDFSYEKYRQKIQAANMKNISNNSTTL